MSDSAAPPAVLEIARRQYRLISALIAAAFAAATTLLQITLSTEAGALSLPPTYDDVAYFNLAADLLARFRGGGAWAVLEHYVAQPPHSPFSVIFGAIGFALLGLKPWAANAMMALPLALLIFWLFQIARDVPIWLTSLVVFALLGSPLAGILITEFRPDPLCGLLTAGGIMVVIWRPWSAGETTPGLAAGALFGLALWTKPALFPLTIALFGTAFLAASIPNVMRADRRRALFRAWALSIGAAIVVSASYFLVAFNRVVEYFLLHYFGSPTEVWRVKLSWQAHALYYLTGAGGTFTLGAWLYLTLAAGLGWGAVALIRRDRAALGNFARTAAVIAACYAIVSQTSYKTGFIGIALTCLLMAATALVAIGAARALARSGRTALAAAAALAFAIFSILAFDTPWGRMGRAALAPSVGADKARMVTEVADALERQSLDGANILEPVVAQYLNSSTINFALHQRGLKPVTPIGFDIRGQADEYRKAFDRADVAIAFAPDADVIPWLPAKQLRREFLERLKSDADWILVRRIEDRSGAGPVFLFRRRPTLGEGLEVQGLRPIEGPYPQWTLPKVRWAYGDQSTIVVEGAPGRKARLVIEVRAPMEGQTITAKLGETTLGTYAAPNTLAFARHEIEFAYPPSGRATVTLAYARSAGMAVLYKTLMIAAAGAR